MRSNKELTPQEFQVSINIKRALNELSNGGNTRLAKKYLLDALSALHA